MADVDSFAHYRVLRREDGSAHELGRGAMGVLYKAFDTRLHCTVALKVINANILNSELVRARFLREARSAAKLHHPNVATVFHLQDEGDTFFYAMEFIAGETLEAYIARLGSLPLGRALNITLQVSGALVAAQREGLVHRDIKPSNLMLVEDQDDEGELRVKVVDFGLAKSFQAGKAAALTLSGFVGTAAFASPEQQDEREIDARADIYSLGATLWFMLIGRPMFTGSLAKVMGQHLSCPPPFEDLGEIPATVRALVERMLAKDPADRFQTPRELRQELRACLEEISVHAGARDFRAPPVRRRGAGSSTATGSSAAAGSGSTPPSSDRPTTGTVLGRRYRLLDATGQGRSGGTVYVAEDLDAKNLVNVELLPGAYSPSQGGARLDALATVVGKLQRAAHVNLVEVKELARTGPHPFLVYEHPTGVSLLTVLRARGALRPAEVLGLLEQLAAAADHARVAGLDRLDLRLASVLVVPPRRPAAGAALDRGMATTDASALVAPSPGELKALTERPLEDWGAYHVKVPALDSSLGEDGEGTLANPEVTLLPAADLLHDTRLDAPGAEQAGRDDYLPELGWLVYELLGGKPPAQFPDADPHSAPGRRPSALSVLTEAGNEILQECFGSDHAERTRRFPDARAFFTALREESRNLPTTRPEPPTVALSRTRPTSGLGNAAVLVEAGPSAEETLSLGSDATASAPVAPVRSLAPRTASRQRRYVLFGIASVVTLGLAGAGLAVMRSSRNGHVPAVATVPANRPEPTPPAPPSKPDVAPAPVAPVAVVKPPENPEQQLEAFLRSGEDADRAGNWSGCLAAYLEATRRFPDFDEPRERLNRLMPRLQPVMDDALFGRLRPQLTEAAKGGSAAAMVLLGGRLLRAEPAEAFRWFQSAAEGGRRRDAMTQVGLMSLQGMGLPAPDAKGAVGWFERAATLGDDRAKYELAQVLLEGAPGVPQDADRAVGLLREAANLQNADAANRLGTLYRGDAGDRVGSVRKSAVEAVKWFKQAKEAGNLDAMANLGAAYINGQGAEINVPWGMELLSEAAHKGSPRAMLLYARCLERGIGTPDKRADTANARLWYVKAAGAGVQEARNWCLENRVEFGRANP